jgi:hypothetical protein
VVAARSGDNAAVTLALAQAQQLGQRATDLERSGLLLVLALEQDFSAALFPRRCQTDQGSDDGVIVDPS